MSVFAVLFSADTRDADFTVGLSGDVCFPLLVNPNEQRQQRITPIGMIRLFLCINFLMIINYD
jgi:hypothetical protein